MAFWNAPIHQDDHADRAVTAALEIRAVVASLNAARLAAGQAPLITRIGIHTGPVLVGNIGARERMNYTIVGDAVNVAARLEALGKDMGETLCISSDTHDATNTARRWARRSATSPCAVAGPRRWCIRSTKAERSTAAMGRGGFRPRRRGPGPRR